MNNTVHTYKFVANHEIIVTDESCKKNSHTWTDSKKLFEFETIQLFYDYILKYKLTEIVDIGAQSGMFCLMAKFLPETKWHAFEPDPSNNKLLIDNIKLNNISNINVYSEALGDFAKNGILNVCPDHRGLNTMGKKLIRFSEKESQKISVQVNTLDNIFEKQKIDLIKIDTEGSEFDILKGGMNVIRRDKPRILLEYVEINLQQFEKNFNDLHELIEELNYKITLHSGGNIMIEAK
jgi:FkbM family methyltransferase